MAQLYVCINQYIEWHLHNREFLNIANLNCLNNLHFPYHIQVLYGTFV